MIRALVLSLALAGCGSVQDRDEATAAQVEARRVMRAAIRAAAVQACHQLRPDTSAHPALRLAWAMACGGLLAVEEPPR